MNRVTLTDLNKIEASTNVTSDLILTNLFICDQNLYAISKEFPQIMMKYTIKNLALVDKITIQQLKQTNNKKELKIKTLNQISNIIAFSIYAQQQINDQDSNKFFYIENKNVQSISSHMATINQIITFQNKFFISCSSDLTIRVWKKLQNKVVPNPSKHVLSFHKNEVICLQKYQNCLISGSKDCSIAFWINFELICSQIMNGKIIKIQKCPQSEQIVIFVENDSNQLQINTISMIDVLKYKKPKVTKTIKCNQIKFNFKENYLASSQIDDSFIVFTRGFSKRNEIQKDANLIFVQINLGKILSIYPKKKQFMQSKILEQDQEEQINEKKFQTNFEMWNNILDVKCLGRMILIGTEWENIKLIKI